MIEVSDVNAKMWTRDLFKEHQLPQCGDDFMGWDNNEDAFELAQMLERFIKAVKYNPEATAKELERLLYNHKCNMVEMGICPECGEYTAETVLNGYFYCEHCQEGLECYR